MLLGGVPPLWPPVLRVQAPVCLDATERGRHGRLYAAPVWRPDAEYNRVECAPRPFDDPCFWKAPPPDNKTKRSSTEPLHLAADAPNNVGKKGAQKQMNWALYAFQYGPRAQESTLSEEWNARSKKKAESRVLAAAQSGKQAVYRQYGNHCYSAERANAWTKSDQYPIGVACRAAGANARVHRPASKATG